MFDGSLAIKNAQKQAMARETVAGSLKPVVTRDTSLATSKNSATGSKAEAGASRFSDFIEDARESEDDRAERLPPTGERAQRMQADQMRARKANVSGKTVVTRESAERPAAPLPEKPPAGKLPVEADATDRPLPKKPPAQEGAPAEGEALAKTDLSEDGEKKPVEDKAGEIVAPVQAEAVKPEPVIQPVAVPQEMVSAPTETGETASEQTVAEVSAAKPAIAAVKTDVMPTVDEAKTETAALTDEAAAAQAAELAKITRATQKEAPKPALATATLASEEAIPDILKAVTPEVQPKPVQQAKVKPETSETAPKSDAKVTTETGATPVADIAQKPVEAVQTGKSDRNEGETPTTGKQEDSTAAKPARETGQRAETAAVQVNATPQAVNQVQPDMTARPPDATLVAGSEGSRLSLTPSTQHSTATSTTPSQTNLPQVSMTQVAVSIATKAMGGSTRFDIRLDPPELGRIDVRLTLDREGRVKSTMVVEKQETYEMMQRDQRGLETAMQQAGLKVNEGSVEFSLRDQSSNNQQNSQSSLTGDREGRQSHRPTLDDLHKGTASSETTTIQVYASLAQQRGGVDLRI